MGFFLRRSFAVQFTKLLSKFGIKPVRVRSDSVLIKLSLERPYYVEIEERGKFVRVTGHPDISFVPHGCPHQLFALLLLRNGELTAGTWRLKLTKDRVFLTFSYVFPRRWVSFTSLKMVLELVLTEINRVALEYRYFQRA